MDFAQIAGFKLPGNVIRAYEATLWSSRLYADGAVLANSSFDVFTSALGSQGSGFGTPLSIAETNLAESSRIPNAVAFTCKAVALEARYDDDYGICRADLVNVQYNCCPAWRFTNTLIDIAPANLIGQGGGIFGATADTGAAEGGSGGSRIILNNGLGQLWQYPSLPVLLPAASTFSISLRFGALAAVVDGGIGNSDMIIRMSLIGLFLTKQPVG